jgi:hypothetical protein
LHRQEDDVRSVTLILVLFAAAAGGQPLTHDGARPTQPAGEAATAAPPDGQQPGTTPQAFAPEILPPDGHLMHSSPALSPDGTELFFSAYDPTRRPRLDVIMRSALEAGVWSEPRVAPFSGQHADNWPRFSRDGDRLYFSSRRPPAGTTTPVTDYGLWYVDRTEAGWASPRQVTVPADFGRDQGPIHVAAALPGGFGDLDIYRLDHVDGSYRQPENLGPTVNTAAQEYSPAVASDGSFLVFARFEDDDQGRRVGLLVSFRNGHGTWSEATDMGARVEAFRDARFPALCPDDSCLFFIPSGGEAVSWVGTEVLLGARPTVP